MQTIRFTQPPTKLEWPFYDEIELEMSPVDVIKTFQITASVHVKRIHVIMLSDDFGAYVTLYPPTNFPPKVTYIHNNIKLQCATSYNGSEVDWTNVDWYSPTLTVPRLFIPINRLGIHCPYDIFSSGSEIQAVLDRIPAQTEAQLDLSNGEYKVSISRGGFHSLSASINRDSDRLILPDFLNTVPYIEVGSVYAVFGGVVREPVPTCLSNQTGPRTSSVTTFPRLVELGRGYRSVRSFVGVTARYQRANTQQRGELVRRSPVYLLRSDLIGRIYRALVQS